MRREGREEALAGGSVSAFAYVSACTSACLSVSASGAASKMLCKIHPHPQHGLTTGPRFGLTPCQACHTAGNCQFKDRAFIKPLMNRIVCVSESGMVQLGLIWHHR